METAIIALCAYLAGAGTIVGLGVYATRKLMQASLAGTFPAPERMSPYWYPE